MRRSLILFLISLSLPCAFAQNRTPRRPPPPTPTFGQPLGNLTSSQAAKFADGKDEFTTKESIDEGLGPVFNGRACAECHTTPAIGGSSNRVVTRVATR